MSDKNLPTSDKIAAVVKHNVWTNVLTPKMYNDATVWQTHMINLPQCFLKLFLNVAFLHTDITRW